MGGFDAAKGKWNEFRDKAEPVCKVFRKIGHGIGVFFSWIYKLRRVIMTVPVAAAALALAWKNSRALPESVGVFIQANGSYALNITHGTAVFFPLVVTGLCLLLMFCSKKPLYPWLISIMTLIIPFYMLLSTLMPV